MSANEPPVLQAEGLSRYYRVKPSLFDPARTLRALDGVSFTLDSGQTLAVVGESGCGKSTLARVLSLIEPPTAGSLKLGGEELSHSSAADRRHRRQDTQIVFQDPFGSLNPRKKVGKILEEPILINRQSTAAERRAAALEMMDVVGLRREHYDRYPHMFSGGQRQRIAIARALMLNPRVLVADEPVSALDVSIQAQILNLLLDLRDTFRPAVVFISHDLSVVRFIADEVLVMYLGRPVEQGAIAEVFDRPGHPYTRALIASTPKVDRSARRERIALKGEIPSPLDPPSGCAFHNRCPYATDRCASERPNMRQFAGRLVACHHAEELAD